MWRRLDRESGLRCTCSAFCNQDSMSLKNRERYDVKSERFRKKTAQQSGVLRFTFHDDTSVANSQPNNRAIFSAGPALGPIGKR